MARITLTRFDHLVSVQDAGRVGAMRYGVSQSGPMDWVRFAHALALTDGHTSAAFEIGITGLDFAVEGRVTVALTGPGFSATVDGSAPRTVDAPARLAFSGGEKVKITAGQDGMWAYLAVAGIDFGAPILGSFATNVRTGLGAHDLGVPFHVNDAGGLDELEALDIALPPGPIGLLPGPQHHLFPEAAQETIVETPYTLTGQTDRMGYRLEGEPLKARTHDIISDGIVEGAIQVPGNGQPIVLCADRAPTGGYPKIAVLSTAHRPRLTQSRPGTQIDFAWIDLAAANDLRQKILSALKAPPAPRVVAPTGERLGSVNLISGVTRGNDQPANRA